MELGEYVFDIDKIVNFVFDGKQENNTEICDSYVVDEETNEMILSNRVIREVKSNGSNNYNTIKYDLLKMFIDTLLEIEINNEKGAITFGENTIINTLINNGLIKKISNV